MKVTASGKPCFSAVVIVSAWLVRSGSGWVFSSLVQRLSFLIQTRNPVTISGIPKAELEVSLTNSLRKEMGQNKKRLLWVEGQEVRRRVCADTLGRSPALP